MGATAAGSRRDESRSVRHAGRKSGRRGKQKDGPDRWISRSCFVFVAAGQEFSDGTFAVRASRILVSRVTLHNEAERTFVVHIRQLQITHGMKSSNEVQLYRV